MDNFDNFFDGKDNGDGNGNGGGYYCRTPIYHTPDPETQPKDGRKFTRVTVLFVVIAVIMCLAMIVNIIVLTSLKDEIAAKYAASMKEAIYSEYYNAVKDVADDMDISEDLKDEIADKINTSAAKVAGEQTVKSTVNISTTFTTSFYDGVSKSYESSSSGFLVTAEDADGNQKQYVVTNAHCVLYPVTVNVGFGGFQSSAAFKECTTITCSFSVGSDAGKSYSLKIVKAGSYYETKSNNEPVSYDYQEMPDLAILEFSGTAPDSSEHPSLSVATSDVSTYGDDIAIVGYPMYEDLSVTDGVISSPAHTMTNWGYGDFYTISAAVNSGNSGGPLVNNRNEVLGVVEASMSLDYAENIGYAVTATTLREFASSSTFGGVSLTIVNA